MTVASTQTLFDHTLKKAIDTPGTTGAAVYLKDPERAVLLLAAALGQRAASGAPWPGEIAWADGGAAAEPLTDVETDQTTLTVPLLLGEDEIGAVVVSASRHAPIPHSHGCGVGRRLRSGSMLKAWRRA